MTTDHGRRLFDAIHAPNARVTSPSMALGALLHNDPPRAHAQLAERAEQARQARTREHDERTARTRALIDRIKNDQT